MEDVELLRFVEGGGGGGGEESAKKGKVSRVVRLIDYVEEKQLRLLG